MRASRTNQLPDYDPRACASVTKMMEQKRRVKGAPYGSKPPRCPWRLPLGGLPPP